MPGNRMLADGLWRRSLEPQGEKIFATQSVVTSTK